MATQRLLSRMQVCASLVAGALLAISCSSGSAEVATSPPPLALADDASADTEAPTDRSTLAIPDDIEDDRWVVTEMSGFESTHTFPLPDGFEPYFEFEVQERFGDPYLEVHGFNGCHTFILPVEFTQSTVAMFEVDELEYVVNGATCEHGMSSLIRMFSSDTPSTIVAEGDSITLSSGTLQITAARVQRN